MAQPVQIQFWAKANFTELSRAVANVNAQLGLLNASALSSSASMASAFSGVNKDFARMAGASGMWSSQLVNIETQTQRFAKSLSMGKTTMRDYSRELRNLTRGSDSLVRKLAAQQVRMQQSILVPMSTSASGKSQAQLLTPQANFLPPDQIGADSLAKSMRLQQMSIMNKMLSNASTQVINLGKNTQWTGRQLTMGLTFPLTAIGALATSTFISMEKELVRLAKVYGDTGGSSVGAIKEIQGAVRDLARELGSTLGVKLEETISMAADFAAMGLSGEGLLGAVRQTTRLQILGDLDQDQAIKTTMALQTAFRQNTEELTESINFLNAVENQTALQLNDVTIALPKVAPVIQAFGGDVKELALFLTAMREGAVPAGEAANALKTSIGRLINPTRQAKDTLNSLGINIEEIVSKNAGNLTQLFLDLQSELDKLNDLDKSKVLERLFGKMQQGRLTALVNNLGRSFSQTSEVIKLMDGDISELAATANRELMAIANSSGVRLQGKIQELRDTFARFGEQTTPVFLKLLDQVIKFTQALDRIPTGMKKFFGLGLLFTAIIGPVVMMTGVFLNFIGTMFKALSSVGAFLGKLLGVKAFSLITAESQAAALAQTNLANNTNNLSAATTNITQSMNVYLDRIKALITMQATLANQTNITTGSIARQSQAIMTGGVGPVGAGAAILAGSRSSKKSIAAQTRGRYPAGSYDAQGAPIGGRFITEGVTPMTKPSSSPKASRIARAGAALSGPKSMGVSMVGILAGMAMSSSDNDTVKTLGKVATYGSMLMFIPGVLASIGVAAKLIIPVIGIVAALGGAIFILFKRSQNAKQSISDLGSSFANSQSFLDSYGITINSLSDNLKNNLTSALMGTRKELEKIDKDLSGNESYDAIKRMLEIPTFWERVKGKIQIPDEALAGILQSEFDLQIALGMPPGEAGNIIKAALQAQGRTDLFYRINFSSNITKDQALQSLLDRVQGDELRTRAVRSYIEDGIMPDWISAKKEIATYEGQMTKTILALDNYISDLLGKFVKGEMELSEIVSTLNTIEVDRITMDKFNESIISSNEELFETDKILKILVETTDNLADKMLVTFLNSQGVNSSLISLASTFGNLEKLGETVQKSEQRAQGFVSNYIKFSSDDSIQKSAEARKKAIDNQVKALQKQIDALKEIGRQEQNINRLKELQLKLDDRRKNLMADYIDSFTSGDLDSALRAQLNLSSAQAEFQKEYGDAKDEISRENKIKNLEDEIQKLEELKNKINDTTSASKNNANQIAKDMSIATQVLSQLAVNNAGVVGLTAQKITSQINNLIKKNPQLSEFFNIAARYGIKANDMLGFVKEDSLINYRPAGPLLSPPETVAQAERLDRLTVAARQESEARRVSVTTNRDVNVTGSTINVNTKGDRSTDRTAPTEIKLTKNDYKQVSLGMGISGWQLKTDKSKFITQAEYDKLSSKKDGGIIKPYKAGGYVTGPGTGTSDSIPAKLSAGEYVIKASSVKKYGKDTLDAMNFGGGGLIPYMNMGGMVKMPRYEPPPAQAMKTGGMIPGYPMGGLIPYQAGGIVDNSGMQNILSQFKSREGKGSPKDLLNAAMMFFPYGKLVGGIGKVFNKVRNLNKKPKNVSEFLGMPTVLGKNPAFSSVEEFIQRPMMAYAESGEFTRKGIAKFLNDYKLKVKPGEKYRALSEFDVDQLSKLKPGDIWYPNAPKSFGHQSDLSRLGAAINPNKRENVIGNWTNTAMARIDVLNDSVPGINSMSSIGRPTGIVGEGMFGPSVGYIINDVPGPKGGSYILRAIDLAGKKMGGYIKGYGMGGPTDDSILARISNGEYVMSAKTVKKMGVGFMDKLNAGSLDLPGYSMGGPVNYGKGGYAKYANGGSASNSTATYNYSPNITINGTNLTESDIKDIIMDTQKEFVRKVGRWNK